MGNPANKKRGHRRARLLLGSAAAFGRGASDYIPGPKLRAKLGISAVTLWRWRHDPTSGFPAPKVIKGRLYFPLGAVEAWLAQQPDAT
jgi:predicted DNA-binding transcriptional regulator AlpA